MGCPNVSLAKRSRSDLLLDWAARLAVVGALCASAYLGGSMLSAQLFIELSKSLNAGFECRPLP